MGTEVYGGSHAANLTDADPLKRLYNEGTRAYSLGMMLASGVTLFLAPLLPAAASALGEGRLWFVLEVVHVAILLVGTRTTSRNVAIATVGCFGGAPPAARAVTRRCLWPCPVVRAAEVGCGAGG